MIWLPQSNNKKIVLTHLQFLWGMNEWRSILYKLPKHLNMNCFARDQAHVIAEEYLQIMLLVYKVLQGPDPS